MTNSNIEIVERVKWLRNAVGVTQEEMAKMLGISRLTYINIESGERKLKEQEIEMIAQFFEMSKDELYNGTKENSSESISEKHPNYMMINTILYILNKCAGKPNVGKIVLNKLLYFSDFNHYEKYWKSITDDVYIKMPMGPVPKSINEVIFLMKDKGIIQEVSSLYYGRKQTRYIPNRDADITKFSGTQIAEINHVIQKYSDLTGKQLTDISHEDGPWESADSIGDIIEYGMVHYRNPANAVTDQNAEETQEEKDARYTHSKEVAFRDE